MNNITYITPPETLTQMFSVIGEDEIGIPCLFFNGQEYYVLIYDGNEDINTRLNDDLYSEEQINDYIITNGKRYLNFQDILNDYSSDEIEADSQSEPEKVNYPALNFALNADGLRQNDISAELDKTELPEDYKRFLNTFAYVDGCGHDIYLGHDAISFLVWDTEPDEYSVKKISENLYQIAMESFEEKFIIGLDILTGNVMIGDTIIAPDFNSFISKIKNHPDKTLDEQQKNETNFKY